MIRDGGRAVGAGGSVAAGSRRALGGGGGCLEVGFGGWAGNQEKE